MGWKRLALWVVALAALAVGFAAYLSPVAMVTLSNLWALCGF